MNREKMVKNSVIAVSFISLLAIVWLLSAMYHSSGPPEMPPPPLPPPAVSVSSQSARTLQDDFARITEQSLPSVVVIRTGRTVNLFRRVEGYDDVHE